MGWTSYHVEPVYKRKGYSIDRKAECDKLFNCDMVKNLGKYEVLKSSMSGSTYYAAVKRTTFATETEAEKVDIFAAVVLTGVNNKDYFNFSYKDMSESMGPHYYDCPKTILDLLTPTDSEFANEWRKLCYEKLKKKNNPDALSNLPIGSVIKYTRPNGMEVELYKHPAAYQFKRPFWMTSDGGGYVAAKRIPGNYIVVKRGE